jgi:hypothetical protein
MLKEGKLHSNLAMAQIKKGSLTFDKNKDLALLERQETDGSSPVNQIHFTG